MRADSKFQILNLVRCRATRAGAETVITLFNPNKCVLHSVFLPYWTAGTDISQDAVSSESA